MFNKLHDFFDNSSVAYIVGINILIILGLGFVDYISGPEISFSVFYMIPILVSTWYGGKRIGFYFSLTSAIIWYIADVSSGQQYSHILVPVWNTSVRLIFFLSITILVTIIKQKLLLEESLAHTDVLTNLANRRFFMERVDIERTRALRYNEIFTIAYIDIDNFKHVNDTQGHEVGDNVLQHVGHCLTENLREVDLVARLGGDEFAVLFPLMGKEDAKLTMHKMHVQLNDSIKDQQWPISFSIGAMTFIKPMDSSREMIKVVDDLMYDVKRSGKNNTKFSTWPIT